MFHVRLLLHPLVLYVVPSVFSLSIWLLTPIDWMAEWGVNQRAPLYSILVPWAIAFVGFLMGFLVQGVFVNQSKYVCRDGFPQRTAKMVQWGLTGLAVASLLFVFMIAIKNGGVLGFLRPYTVRSSYIAGLSTFLHTTTCVTLMAVCVYLVDSNFNRVSKYALIVVSIIILYRVFIGYERLAAFLPGLAAFVIYIRIRHPRITGKLITVIVLTFLAFVSIYVFAEYYRSFSAKMAHGENIEANPIVYGLKRFVLYFATSVNTGGLNLQFFSEGLDQKPLFSTTLPPLAKILYKVFGQSIFELQETYYSGLEIAREMGAYNDEFNNAWSIPVSFTEGWIVGVIYWIVWGGIANYLYRNFFTSRPTIWDLILYGLFVAAFIDNQSRVGLLGAIHFLLPFITIYGLKVYYQRRISRFTFRRGLRNEV